MSEPTIYEVTRLQLIAPRKGDLQVWAFGREPGGPEVMLGEVPSGAVLGAGSSGGVLRLVVGRTGDRLAFEQEAVARLAPSALSAGVAWLREALAAHRDGRQPMSWTWNAH